MATKSIFINAVSMVSLDGHESIPTAIRYVKGQQCVVGFDAVIGKGSLEEVNEDFKIHLGKIKPGQAASTRARFACGDGEFRSAYNLAADFFQRLRVETAAHVSSQRMEMAKHVLVSEPLSFYASSNTDWLENYRGNIRRILGGAFDDVQFLPEPFAVYQYYRYGKRHPIVEQDRKHCALVIDFGGGTFDVSVVETSKTGDISQKGKHARPLGAHSKDVGGFEINRLFAKSLISRAYFGQVDKDDLRKGLENYYRVREGDLDLGILNERNQTFIRWFGRLLRQVEDAKIALSRKISNWRLDASLSSVVSIQIPEDPFRSDANTIPLRVTGESLRDLFVTEIWRRQLKGCVRLALDHARKELDGRPIDIVLLSGGSANLRWLETLLKDDFEEDLCTAHVVTLRDSYQEVVAKGLAIECARRGYEPNSEFSDVTYNPLYLLLDPDDTGSEAKRFKLVQSPPGVGEPTEPGELLPSAESFDIEEEVELIWKVRLDRPPKHCLNYFFARAPSGRSNLEDRYNVVETRAGTPPGIHFDSHIRVQLSIRNDGTCTPTFVYRSDTTGAPADFVVGQPFCIDLVSANQKASRSAFVGIDFGTASSSVSFVDWQQIEEFENRGKDELWLSLNELVDLPTPLAVPIKAMLGATRKEDQARFAMDSLEGFLCFAAFACWAETSASGEKMPKCFNANWKRSAGPLKKLLLDLVDSKATGVFVTSFRKRLTADVRRELDRVIQELDDEKHQKRALGTCEPRALLETLGNACKDSFKGWEFGYFEDVVKVGFQQKFRGTFRVADGAPPFHRQLSYEGNAPFSELEALLVRPSSGEVLSMSPLYVWFRTQQTESWSECMIFDGIGRTGDVSYKKAGGAMSVALVDPEWADLKAMILGVVAGEVCGSRGSGCTFVDGDEPTW